MTLYPARTQGPIWYRQPYLRSVSKKIGRNECTDDAPNVGKAMDAENGERDAFGGLLVDKVVCPPRGESLCTVIETGWVCGVHFGG